MPIRNLIGTLVWRYRFKILPALIFTAGFLGYFFIKGYFDDCGDGKSRLLARIAACTLNYFTSK